MSVTKFMRLFLRAAIIVALLASCSGKLEERRSAEIEGALQRAGELLEGARPEEALEVLSRAESAVEAGADRQLSGQLLSKEAEICYGVFDWDRAVAFSRRASEFFLKDGDYLSYAECLLDVAEASLINSDPEYCREMLGLVSRHLDKLDEESTNRYYDTLLEALMEDESEEATEQIESILSSYFSEGIAPMSIDWLVVSEAYYRTGDRTEAERCLSRYENSDPAYTTYPPYYKYKAKLEKELGNSSRSLSAYERYVFLCDSLDNDILDEGTRHIKESYERTEVSLKERLRASRRNALSIIGGLISLLLIYYIFVSIRKYLEKSRLHRNLKRRTERVYREAQEEKDILKDIKSNSVGLGDATEKIIRKRLSALEKLLKESVGHDSESISSHLDRLEEVTSARKEFIFSTAFGFACSHPNTMSWLISKGLSDSEIVYCAMFLIGMNNKEISSLISSGNGYNLSSSVRKKLGLTSHDTNLNLFLRQKFSELEA